MRGCYIYMNVRLCKCNKGVARCNSKVACGLCLPLVREVPSLIEARSMPPALRFALPACDLRPIRGDLCALAECGDRLTNSRHFSATSHSHTSGKSDSQIVGRS